MLSVGEMVKKRRIEAGLTQADVAEKLGITESAVGQFERPDANPTVDTLSKLSKVLGCCEADFFPVDDEPTLEEKIVVNIRRLLKQRGVKQTKIADVCGVSRPTVTNWFARRNFMRIEHLVAISKFFNVSLDELVM